MRPRDVIDVMDEASAILPALPFPLRRYRTTAVPPMPSHLSRWKYAISVPPYSSFAEVNSVQSIPTRSADAVAQILVASPVDLDPDGLLEGVGWLCQVFFGMSLVLNVTARPEIPPITALATRAARVGAVVVARECDGPRTIARSVLEAFVPHVDLPRWLLLSAPKWAAEPRGRAIEDLLGSYRYDPLTQADRDRKRPRHQRIWQGVGRALRAAIDLQRADERPLLKVAFDSGYSDHRAMDRALLRKFGLRAQEVRGTAGWEWLMWRFLCGRGSGREKRWDQ